MTGIMLITGGSRGIGAATAILAANRGYAVCVNYAANAQAADAVVAQIKEAKGRAIAVQADVSKADEIDRLFETCDKELGTLDVLINNAGVLDKQCRLEDIDEERIDRLFATNVKGSFLCARAAIKRMSKRHGGQGGAIVNVSSVAARLGSPNEYIDYAATKGAMDTMTIGLAKELGEDGIRVNAVRPGIIETDMHTDGGEPGRVARIGPTLPMGRGGTPEEVAQVIVWLASDDASYVTGALIDIGGGR